MEYKVSDIAEKLRVMLGDSTIDIPNEFIAGYALDYAERYRNLPFIGILKEEVYSS